MFESHIVKKVKRLEAIKPRKEWVFSAKEEILDSDEETYPVVSWFPVMFNKPALVYVPVLMVAVFLTGFFVYSNYQVDNLNHVVMEAEMEKDINLTSLENLKTSLKEMELSLARLREKEDKKEALVMSEIVKSTAKEGERVVDNIRNSGMSFEPKVLATLDGLDKTCAEVTGEALAFQKEGLASQISFLEGRSLTPEDQARLEKAKEFYEAGKEDTAMLLITKINNN